MSAYARKDRIFGIFPVGKMSKRRRKRRIVAITLLTGAIITLITMFVFAIVMEPDDLARIQPILQAIATILIVSTTIVQI